MHDTPIPTERLDAAIRSDNVIELPARTLNTDNRVHSNGGTFQEQTPSRMVNPRPVNEPIPLDQVRERMQSDDKGKWDIVLPRNEVLMRDGKIIFPNAKAYECENGVAPSPWATGQICQRLNIPTAYFKRCPVYLQDAQFNFWNAKKRSELRGCLETTEVPNHACDDGCDPFDREAMTVKAFDQSEPEGYQNGWSQGTSNGHKFKNGIYAGTEKGEYWLLRAKGESLRAVLTERYTPLDNRTLLDALHKALPPHLQVQWLALDDESFHLRIIDPRMTKEILSDDPLMAGLHIANSEVGRRSVSVDVMVWRQVCSNGLIKLVRGKNLLCQRHVSISPHHFTALLRQSLSSALSHAQDFMERMAWSTTEPIKDVESEMKALMQHYHLSQSFTDQVKTSLQNERSDQQNTVFGLTNALTAAAQTLDAEARYDVEVLAGKLLERRSMQHADGSPRPRKARVLKALPESEGQSPSEVSEAIEAAEVLFETERVEAAQA
jgi:hypothetical protein